MIRGRGRFAPGGGDFMQSDRHDRLFPRLRYAVQQNDSAKDAGESGRLSGISDTFCNRSRFNQVVGIGPLYSEFINDKRLKRLVRFTSG